MVSNGRNTPVSSGVCLVPTEFRRFVNLPRPLNHPILHVFFRVHSFEKRKAISMSSTILYDPQRPKPTILGVVGLPGDLSLRNTTLFLPPGLVSATSLVGQTVLSVLEATHLVCRTAATCVRRGERGMKRFSRWLVMIVVRELVRKVDGNQQGGGGTFTRWSERRPSCLPYHSMAFPRTAIEIIVVVWQITTQVILH